MFDPNDNYTRCPICADRYMMAGSSMCHACLEQRMIDDAVPGEEWYEEDPDAEEYQPCPHCNGTGRDRYDMLECDYCGGEG